MRCNAYVLAGDPVYLAASVHSYYAAVNRIVVAYDEDGRSWSGDILPMEECLAELRHIDLDRKLDLRPSKLSHPELSPMECETRARRSALEEASHDADWVMQLDSDEVITDLGVFVDMLGLAEGAGADALDFPSRWLYARTGDRRFLEGCSRWWRAAAGYPGPLAVRAGAVLRHARQSEGNLFRVDFRQRNTDPWRTSEDPVHATVPVSAGVLHFSWVRTSDQMAHKAKVSSHRDDVDWEAEMRKWRWRRRHPLIASALTPLRRRELLHPSWLRHVRLSTEPSASMLATAAAQAKATA